MSNDIDIKQLWKKRESKEPDLSVLEKQVKDFERQKMISLILANLCLSATAIGIYLIWVYFEPVYLSTKWGIIAIITSIVIYLLMLNGFIPWLRQIKGTESNNVFLTKLLRIRNRQRVFNRIVANLYFALLSVGLALYMYEYASRMTLFWATITYVLTGSWIVVNWLYFFPKGIKKNEAKLNDLISGFQKLKDQLNNEP